MSRPTTALVTVLLAALPLAGCTAGIATARLVSATKSVHDAEERGAPVMAPYQFTLAQRHLHKALEEHGDAEYKVSVELAKAAASWAEASVVFMEGGGRDIKDNGKAGDDLTDNPLMQDDLLSDPPPPKPIDVVPQDEPEEKPDDEFLQDPEDDAWDGEEF